MAETNDDDERTKLLQFFIDYYGRYHDHKETMAWIITAFYIGGVMYMTFEARRVIENCDSWQIPFAILFGVLGFIVLRFVCWQLGKRKDAANYVLGFMKQLRGALVQKNIRLPKKLEEDLDKESDNQITPTSLTYAAIIGMTIAAIILVLY